MSRSIPCVIAALCLAPPALAQEQDQELWLTGAAGVPVSDDADFELDTVARFGNDPGGLYEVEINAMLSHELGGGLKLGGGYTRNIGYSRGTVTSTENRLRAQLAFATTAGPVKLSGRMRLEVRFRAGGDDIGYRLRPQLKAALPVGGPFILVYSHESFVQLNNTDWGQRQSFERMRNAVGLNWKASKTVALEVAYMNQYAFRPAPQRDLMDHALTIGTSFSF